MSATTRLSQEQILDRLRERFPDSVLASDEHAGQRYAVVPRERVLEVLEFLRDDESLRLDYLSDVTVTDQLYFDTPELPERFAVVYQLTSLDHGHRFRVKTPVPEDDPTTPSVCGLWKAGLWGEREAHDMYGVRFEGNPDLRRLLMPANYDGFPLRKDYPLRGRGEREDFAKMRKVEEEPGG